LSGAISQIIGAKPQGIKSRHWICCAALGDFVPYVSKLAVTMLIKLNDRGVRVYMASGGAPYRPRADWPSRTGRIARYSRDRSLAYVMWDGTHCFDRVSVGLIEPATPQASAQASPMNAKA